MWKLEVIPISQRCKDFDMCRNLLILVMKKERVVNN